MKCKNIVYPLSIILLAIVPSSSYIYMMNSQKNNNNNKPSFLQQYWETGVHNHKKKCGILVVKVVSSFLPHIEKVGHRVLSFNNNFIQNIMNCKESQLPHHMKGKIILFVIGLAQWGDNMGSHLLKLYHHIIKSSFEE